MNHLSQKFYRWRSDSERIVAYAFLVSVPLGTLIAACLGNIVIGERHISGYAWMAQVPMALFALLICGWGWSRFPVWIWAPWVMWIACRCDWTDIPAVQETIMLMLLPIFGVAAANAITTKDDLRKLTWGFIPIALIGGAITIADGMNVFPFGSLIRPGGTYTTLCLCACYFSVYAYRDRWKGILLWLYCVLCCGIVGARIATAVSVLALPLSPLPFKARSRVFIILGCVVLVAVILILPLMHEKLLYTGEFRLTELHKQIGYIRTHGRSSIWSQLWDEAWANALFGAGADAADRIVWVRNEHHFKQPHNDYIRVFFNYGIIGLVLLGVPVVYTIVDSLRRARRTQDDILKSVWSVSCVGTCAMCLLSITGNTLVYIPYFGLYLFSIIGGAYGLSGTFKRC